jgi:uncharacterized protein (DUF1778 family)
VVRTGRPISDESKKISINIRVTEEQRKILKERAIKKEMNLSEYILDSCMKEILEK